MCDMHFLTNLWSRAPDKAPWIKALWQSWSTVVTGFETTITTETTAVKHIVYGELPPPDCPLDKYKIDNWRTV